MNDIYRGTIDRLEPDIAAIDLTAAAASIAISLKRIADALEAEDITGRNINDLLHVIAHSIECIEK